MNNYRYTLQSYKGIKTRHTCPECQKPKTYTRYIDTTTGEYIPSEYGKCQRLNKCNYHLNPYKNGYSKKIWLQERGNEDWKKINLSQTVYIAPTKPTFKPVFFPLEIFQKSLSEYDRNSFVLYLNCLFGAVMTTDLIKRFYIGSSKHWTNRGATVFWLIDEQMRVAGGQVILYNEKGNTKKITNSDGSKYRFNSWVHTALKKSYESQKKVLPDWLKKYIDLEGNKFPCLFGLPQLKIEPLTKPVAIVEAAKTAIIATAYLPQYIWLAVGGLSYLNQQRLQSLKGRNITLFPDAGGYHLWNEKAKEIRSFANVVVSDLLERKGAEKGTDLADFLGQYNFKDFYSNAALPTDKQMLLSKNLIEETKSMKDGTIITNLINEHGYPADWDNQ